MSDPQPTSEAPPPARRKRRWVRWTGLTVLGLVLLVVVVVQLALMSSLPKRIVMPQVEKLLGLRISADTLSTGWLGHTTLNGVMLGLPLDDTSFLKVKSLKLRHNTLLGLALGRPIAVESIEVDEPDVVVTQDPQGNWNLQQVVVLLGKVGGSETGKASTAETGVPKLPRIKLVDGVVTVKDNRGHTAKLSPVNVDGDPDGKLVWTYELSVGPKDAEQVHVKGEVAPGSNWQHRLTADVANLDSLVKGFGGPGSYGAAVHAKWDGALAAGGKVAGTLTLTEVSAHGVPSLGDVAVTGGVGVVADADGTVTVRPAGLLLKTGNLTLPNLSVAAGAIVYNGQGLHAQDLKVNALGGAASVDADVDPRSLTSTLSAHWTGLAVAHGIDQDGVLTASLAQPFPGQPVIHVGLESHGRIGRDATLPADQARNRWDAKLDLTGQGSSWNDIDWVLTTPALTYTSAGKTYKLNGLSASVTERLPSVRLTNLSLPVTADAALAPFFNGTGAFNSKTKAWNFDLTGGANASFDGSPVPVTLALHTKGTAAEYDLKELTVTAADTTLTADGSYDLTKPAAPTTKPVDPVALHIKLSQTRQLAPEGPVQGSLSGDFTIVGDVFPEDGRKRPYLHTTGKLQAGQLVLFGRPIGDVDIDLAGDTASPKLADGSLDHVRTQIDTTAFYLFQAPWTFSVLYPNNDDDEQLQVTLSTTRLPLDVLAKAAGSTQAVGGQVTSAKWTLLAGGTGIDDVRLLSEYHLANVSAAGLNVDSVDATASVDKGILRLDNLTARSGPGRTTVTASLDLRHPQTLTSETTVENWPYPISSALGLRASAHAQFDVDLQKGSAAGRLTANGDLLLTKVPLIPTSLAHLDMAATVNNRAIDLRTFTGRVLNGTVDGSATVDFDKPLLAVGRFQWQGIDAGKIAEYVPAVQGLAGVYSGTVTIAPTRDPRPLGPVRVDVNVASAGAHFRTVKLGQDGPLPLAFQVVAYASTDRVVIDHATAYAAGGVVNLWGRVGDHQATRQLLVDFDRLDLDQIAHLSPTFKPTEKVPGRLAGRFGFVNNGSDLSRLLGEGHADLTRTDLGNFGPVAALNQVLLGGSGGDQPTGYGSVDLRFEQSTLDVTGFRYFNRGLDAHGLFAVGPFNLDNPIGTTPIGGQVVGTIRAAKDSQIQLFSDFDQVFAALQRNLTTFNVTGSIDKHQIGQAGTDDIGNGLRQLVVGDAQAAQAANQSSQQGQ